MTFPEEELPHVAEAACAQAREPTDAGAWVFGGGPPSILTAQTSRWPSAASRNRLPLGVWLTVFKPSAAIGTTRRRLCREGHRSPRSGHRAAQALAPSGFDHRPRELNRES